MLEDDRVDIVVGIDINATHKLDELSRRCQVMAAGFVQRFADEVESNTNFFVFFSYA